MKLGCFHEYIGSFIRLSVLPRSLLEVGMENQLQFGRMDRMQVFATQSSAQPISSQTKYNKYSYKINATLGIIQALCGLLLIALNVSNIHN